MLYQLRNYAVLKENCNHGSNVVVEWLTLLLRILEVPATG
jgi:hypothetical protein